jgi:hypothetical protein
VLYPTLTRLLAVAARRWPAAQRGDLVSSGPAEAYELAHEPGVGAASGDHRHERVGAVPAWRLPLVVGVTAAVVGTLSFMDFSVSLPDASLCRARLGARLGRVLCR